MDKYNRIYNLHRILSNSQYPIAKQTLQEQLQCTDETMVEAIAESKNFLDAPIVYDKKLNGYYYDKNTKQEYELPGLWFNASELHALLAAYQLLSKVQPGFLGPHLAPLKKRIEDILDKEHYDTNELFNRVRILQIGGRVYSHKHFAMVTTALLSQKQIHIVYHGREKNLQTERTLSPQRLVYYRDNWYLDAWCHLRGGLRSFSIDKITSSKLVNQARHEIKEIDLNRHYENAYGIFAGEATQRAQLRFNSTAARWVAYEHWHSQQSGQHELDGCYLLEVPFNDPRELIRDILKYGPDVEVIGPRSLREEVRDRLQAALDRYAPTDITPPG
ncbi:MAG: helix-turn-helix transcriptional regulator [Thiohalomonadales bacterium]